PSATASRVSAARRVAYDVVRRTFEDGAYTDRALRAEAARAGLEGRELAFANRLAYETVQRRRTLDALIAELTGRDLGRLEARALMAANNEPAETAVRVNTLVADPAVVAARTGGRRVDGLEEGLVLDRLPALGAELMPQSRASMAVARALAPRPGERVLDLCA